MNFSERTYRTKSVSQFFLKHIKYVQKIFPIYLTLFIGFWLSFAKISITSFIPPNYIIGIIFFWTLYRPDLLSLGGVVLGGLLWDTLYDLIPGQTSLLWSLIYIGILSQRRFLIKKPFTVVWTSFALTVLCYLGGEVLFSLIFEEQRESLFSLGIHFLMTIGIYPFITLFLIYVGKGVSLKPLKEI